MLRTLFFPFLKRFRKLLISMTVISCIGIMMLAGLSSGAKILEVSYLDYVRAYQYSDAVITIEDTASAFLADSLRDVEGVNSAHTRLCADAPIRAHGKLLNIRAFTYGPQDFQRFYTYEKNENADYVNIKMDEGFATAHEIHAGEIIEIRLDDEYEEVCVGSIVSLPESLMKAKDQYSWFVNSDFGYIYCPSILTLNTDYQNECNQFLLTFDSSHNPDDVLERCEQALESEGLVVASSYTYADSPVQKKLEDNLIPLQTLAVFVPLVFFIIMLAVNFLFLSFMIRQSRREIGILRALGFRRSKIMALFCLLTFGVTVIACIIGLGFSVLLAKLTGKLFLDFLRVPETIFIFDTGRAILAIVLTVLMGQLSALLSTGIISSVRPAEAMSRNTPTSSSIPGFLQALTSRLQPLTKFSVLSIVRNGKRFVFSAVCIAASITVVFVSLSFNKSKDYLMEEMFDMRLNYDVQLFMDEKPTDELLANITSVEGVSALEQMGYYSITVQAANAANAQAPEKEILVNSIEPDSNMVRILGSAPSYPGNQLLPYEGIVLESSTAEYLGVHVGDAVLVGDAEMTVAALTTQNVNRISYISFAQAESLGDPDRSVILCQTTNEKALIDYMANQEDFSYAVYTETMRTDTEETFAVFLIAVGILVGVSMIIGFVIIFNTTQTTLLERRRELASMRALGFQVNKLSLSWFSQTALQFFIGCLIGIPSGAIFAGYALNAISVEERQYPFIFDPMSLLFTIGLVFLYVVVSHLLATRNMRSWNIAELVKDKE